MKVPFQVLRILIKDLNTLGIDQNPYYYSDTIEVELMIQRNFTYRINYRIPGKETFKVETYLSS